MGAQEIANFILRLDDQLTSGSARAANSILSLGSKAKDATKAIDQMAATAKASVKSMADDLSKNAKGLNNNQLLAQFETLSSLLVQVGGGASQVGILLSSLARPVATAASVFGGMTLAIGGATLGLGLLAVGTRAAINATEQWIYDSIEVRQKLIDQRDMTVDVARNLVEYAKATDKLETESAQLRVEIADKLAPAFQELTDAGTGFVRMLDDMQDGTNDVDTRFSALIQTLGGLAGNNVVLRALGVGLENLAKEGSYSTVQYDANYGPRLPTNFDERELKRLRSYGEGPEFDPGAAFAHREAEREKAENEAEAAARKEAAAIEEAWNIYHAMQDDIRGLIRDLDKIANDSPAAVFESAGIRYRADEAAKAAAQAIKDEAQLAQYEAAAKAQRTQGLNAAASAFTGADVSSIVSTAGGGPWGAVFSAVAGGDSDEMLEGIFDQVMEIYSDLPEQIGVLAGELVPSLVRAAPEMAAAFTVLAPSVVAELIKASPKIFEALIDAILDLPRAFRDAFSEMFNLFGETADAVGVDGRRQRRTQVQPAGDMGSRGGSWIPAAPQSSRSSRARTGGGGGINIGQIVAPNPRDLVRQLRQIQGPYGYNEDTSGAF